MATYYFTDADLTARLSTLSSVTELNTADKRTAAVRAPAKAWVDTKFPYDAPFADIAAEPATPDLIRLGAIEYGIFLARRLATKDTNDKMGRAARDNALDLFNVDSRTGLARAVITAGEDVRFAHVDVTRSIDAEDDDEQTNRDALWP